MNNGKHSGAFLSVDNSGIKLHEKTGDTSVERENVSRVTVSAHRVQHAVLGLAIGAIAGVVLPAHKTIYRARCKTFLLPRMAGVSFRGVAGISSASSRRSLATE